MTSLSICFFTASSQVSPEAEQGPRTPWSLLGSWDFGCLPGAWVLEKPAQTQEREEGERWGLTLLNDGQGPERQKWEQSVVLSLVTSLTL